MKTKLGVLLALSCAGLVAAVAVARSASTDGTLQATVGPGFSISLTQNGTRVTHLDPGTYTVDVRLSSGQLRSKEITLGGDPLRAFVGEPPATASAK